MAKLSLSDAHRGMSCSCNPYRTTISPWAWAYLSTFGPLSLSAVQPESALRYAFWFLASSVLFIRCEDQILARISIRRWSDFSGLASASPRCSKPATRPPAYGLQSVPWLGRRNHWAGGVCFVSDHSPSSDTSARRAPCAGGVLA